MSKFTLSLNWKIYFGFCCLLLMGFANYSWTDNNMLLFGAMTLLGISYFLRLFDSLTIDREGFKYRSFGIECSGKWSDVKAIDERENFLVDLVRLEGILIVKEKLTAKRNWLLARKYVFIPLSQFSVNWRKSELGSQVKEFLPEIPWEPV